MVGGVFGFPLGKVKPTRHDQAMSSVNIDNFPITEANIFRFSVVLAHPCSMYVIDYADLDPILARFPDMRVLLEKQVAAQTIQAIWRQKLLGRFLRRCGREARRQWDGHGTFPHKMSRIVDSLLISQHVEDPLARTGSERSDTSAAYKAEAGGELTPSLLKSAAFDDVVAKELINRARARRFVPPHPGCSAEQAATGHVMGLGFHVGSGPAARAGESLCMRFRGSLLRRGAVPGALRDRAELPQVQTDSLAVAPGARLLDDVQGMSCRLRTEHVSFASRRGGRGGTCCLTRFRAVLAAGGSALPGLRLPHLLQGGRGGAPRSHLCWGTWPGRDGVEVATCPGLLYTLRHSQAETCYCSQ
eukprot:scaffold625_cov420-Prasinococcus_capsulatus_cf.AAC.70